MALNAVPAVTEVNYYIGKMDVNKHTKINKKVNSFVLS